MKVKLLQNITINGREFPKGQVLDIHHKHVQKYLKSELVEVYQEEAKEEAKEEVKEDDYAHQIFEGIQATQEYSED